MKNTGFILFGLAVCAAADVCAQSAQLELGVEDIAGAAVKEEKLDFGQKKQARTKTSNSIAKAVLEEVKGRADLL